LLDAYEAAEVSLLVPDIFWPECANIAWKAVRQGRLRRADAEMAIQILLDRKIPTIASSELLPEALAIAFNFSRPVRDSLYVSLAAHSKKELVTADEKLANAMASQFPVKWLGAF
jgi:predicted nucleic acid-binding protein